ncbi:excisionase [uncultured Amnibacterium sp.]|uniref:excisionase n=1 Tax=uncultured Amnibacterium sp. TaxID=1631851 RepID=UPI0035CA04C8
MQRTTLTIAETAALIEQSEAVCRRAVEAGTIRAVRLGRNWKVLAGPLREQFGIEP